MGRVVIAFVIGVVFVVVVVVVVIIVVVASRESERVT